MIKAFMTIKHGLDELGTLHLELFDDVVPLTVKNFVALLKGQGRLTYRHSISHRLIPGFMAQFGDFTHGDGTGGESIYGETFDDENFILKHETKGTLSMANSGKNTNGSQFFVTFRKTPHLDGKHVVFGRVDLRQSSQLLRKLEQVKTDSGDAPLKPVIVVDCGVTEPEEAPNQDETDTPQEAAAPLEDQDDVVEEEPEEEEEEGNLSKSQAIKNRLRKLKMKMNQARQLNHRALKAEGESMINKGGGASQQKRGKKLDPEAASLVEPAASSMASAERRAEKKQAEQYSFRDYVNIEGQNRHYERNVKSIPRQLNAAEETAASRTETYDAMMDSTNPEKEREGARRLATEMHRRIEKQSKRKDREDFEESDVTYISKRNKRFNEKISRNYDRATAEIKQSLERGTAL
ncbi:cis-trans isomerase [Seminavis robusta]|uniref:peptidylprolyl isomerase n=1 Tax=Seminavis robusta TaxID=568900 RepID=A0A9N8DL65_9STRA|nr:cis-trans isomerase [Seminavis robusta]|eukprot:Sro191_g082070.1 cis-trans isomerase (407) ;mRNA; f:5969-7377